MNPVWSPEALADLAALRAWIAQDDPAAVQRVAFHIIHNVETLLPASPAMGRPGRVPGTRELVIPSAHPGEVRITSPKRIRAKSIFWSKSLSPKSSTLAGFAPTPYIVPYRLVGNTIQVLRVFHSARRWPEDL
jgi:toxin ParE1/3/4